MRARIRDAALAATLMVCVAPKGAAAADVPVPTDRPACAPNPQFAAIDTSFPLQTMRTADGRPALDRLKTFGVDAIFRYYDLPDETLAGKTLRPAESDAILAAGFSLGAVFQHHNDDPAKFLNPAAGKQDGERALALADANRQPFGSAIYFAVDGPERHLRDLVEEYAADKGAPLSSQRRAALRGAQKSYFIESYGNFLRYGPKAFHRHDLAQATPAMVASTIRTYFTSIRVVFAAYKAKHGGKGYDVGMYCTGAMCAYGRAQKLAKYFWLSPEGRYDDPDYRRTLQNQSSWTLQQQRTTLCAGWTATPPRDGVGFDFDRVNAAQPAFGQWSVKRPPQ